MNRRYLIAALIGAPVAGAAAVAAGRPDQVVIAGHGNFLVNGTRVVVRQAFDPRPLTQEDIDRFTKAIDDNAARIEARMRDRQRRGLT